MPPETGPLIGPGMITMIADEAIEADMGHRRFRPVGDGVFEFSVDTGSGSDSAGKMTVRASKSGIEMTVTPSHYASAWSSWEGNYDYLITDVFEYWPGAIEDAFDKWMDPPRSEPLGAQVTGLVRGLGEIRVVADNATSGEAEGANVRLGSDISNLEDRTGALNGHYAEAFKEQYVTKLRPTLDNLHAIGCVLAYAGGAEEELFSRIREQISDLANKAIPAMRASGPQGGGDTTGLEVALVIVGAAAAGVAAVATAGASVPVTVQVAAALAGAGAGTASGLMGALADEPTAPDPLPLGADHPNGVLENLTAAIESVRTEVRAEEDLIINLLSATAGEIPDGSTGSPFDIAEPGIIGAPSGEVLDREQDISVDPGLIAKITDLWIPTINGDISACIRELDADATAWTRPSGIGYAPTGPWTEFSTLQDRLIDLLSNTKRELSDAGDALYQAAHDLGLTDEGIRQQQEAEANRINDGNINY